MTELGGPGNVAASLVAKLTQRGESLALAESCTGGLVSSFITDVPGASKVFDRCIVAYSRNSKVEELSVEREVLEASGPVCAEVALQMARGVKEVAGAAWAGSVTGFADGGAEDMRVPAGTMFVAVVGRGEATVERYVFDGDRGAVKRAAALQVIEDVLERVDA